LVWYDADGTAVRWTSPGLRIGMPRGLAVADAGDIFLADGDGGRIVHLSPDGESLGQFTAGGRILDPTSVAVAADRTLWVLNGSGELLRVSRDDHLLASRQVSPTPRERGYRMLPAPNGDLIVADPEARRVVRWDRQGALLRVWNGFQYPSALGVDGVGRLYVSDWELDQVAILPPLVDGPQPAATAVRQAAIFGEVAEEASPASAAAAPLEPAAPPFEPDFVYRGNIESRVWSAPVGDVTVTGGQLTVRVAAMPGHNGVYDYLHFLDPEGQEYRFEAEDLSLTSGDTFSRVPGQDGHWWLQAYEHFGGGAALVAEQPEDVPVLETTVSLPDGQYLLFLGTFTGDSASGPFAVALEY
jgi:hypothetical protein